MAWADDITVCWRAVMTGFLQSTYQAATTLAQWDRKALPLFFSPPPPSSKRAREQRSANSFGGSFSLSGGILLAWLAGAPW